MRFAVLKQIWITLTVIATFGVLITGAIITYAGVWLGIPIGVALVLGALTASTDPATLVPIFKQVPIKDRVSQTVMSESALNDAMGAIATFGVVAYVMGTGEGFSLTHSLGELAYEAGMGLVLGAIVVSLVDFLSVSGGPTKAIVESHPELAQLMLLQWSVLGTDGLPPQPIMGMGDPLFLAWFLAGVHKFGWGIARNLAALIVGCAVGYLTVALTERPMPALPFMSAAFLLMNWRRFEIPPEDRKVIFVVTGSLALVIVLRFAVW